MAGSWTSWAGRVLSALTILFLLFDGGVKILQLPVAMDANAKLGLAEALVLPIGLLALLWMVIYAIPTTAVAGAILLTGFLGGAVASQLRAGNPLFSNVLFPVYVGELAW